MKDFISVSIVFSLNKAIGDKLYTLKYTSAKIKIVGLGSVLFLLALLQLLGDAPYSYFRSRNPKAILIGSQLIYAFLAQISTLVFYDFHSVELKIP